MSYSVVQQGLELPTVEQLREAFRNVPGLTAIDALALGKDAFGILARGFELEMAEALKDSLATVGVAAEVCEDAALPKLPEPFNLARVDCTPEALLAHDSLGRVASIAWTDVFMIVAGKVAVQEFKTTHTTSTELITRGEYNILKSVDPRLGAIGDGKHVYTVDGKTREETRDHHLLEIFLNGGTLRYNVDAEKSLMLFAGLGDRRTDDFSHNFLLIVQDLIQHAPHAALNRGAVHAEEDAVAPFTYPNKIAFYHEIVWLLWQVARAQPPAAEEEAE